MSGVSVRCRGFWTGTLGFLKQSNFSFKSRGFLPLFSPDRSRGPLLKTYFADFGGFLIFVLISGVPRARQLTLGPCLRREERLERLEVFNLGVGFTLRIHYIIWNYVADVDRHRPSPPSVRDRSHRGSPCLGLEFFAAVVSFVSSNITHN